MKFEKVTKYDEFAYAQKITAKKLIKILCKYKNEFENIYEIGCGSGILTKEILNHISYKYLTLNDKYKSPIMQNFKENIGDILDIDMPLNLDLVISSSTFQWIENLAKLREKIYLSLKKDGILAFNIFCKGNLAELQNFTNQGLNYKTTDEIYKIFDFKFDILEQFSNHIEIKFKSLKELLNHLKQTGVNNLNGNFKLNKTNLKGLEAHFNENFKLSYYYTILISKAK